MQDVQARIRLVAPFTLACTGRRLTFQRLRDTLCAWLIAFPNSGFLPQISQTCAITAPGRIRNPSAKYRFYRSWGGFGNCGGVSAPESSFPPDPISQGFAGPIA